MSLDKKMLPKILCPKCGIKMDKLRGELEKMKNELDVNAEELKGTWAEIYKLRGKIDLLVKERDERFTVEEMDKAVDNHVNKLQNNDKKDYWTTILKGNWNGIKGELKKLREKDKESD